MPYFLSLCQWKTAQTPVDIFSSPSPKTTYQLIDCWMQIQFLTKNGCIQKSIFELNHYACNRASSMLHPTTYQEDCKFKDTYLLPYLQCTRCDKIFRNPQRMHPCGHTFCQPCSPQVGSACYTCCFVVQVRQTDLTSGSLIADLQVTCNAPGCPFKGTFDQYKSKHQTNCLIRKSGGLDCWIEEMQSTLNNFKDPKKIEIGSEPNFKTDVSESEIENQLTDQMLNYDLRQPKRTRVKQSLMRDKFGMNMNEETFIECIPVDTQKPGQELQCMQLQGAQLFVNSFFKPKKPSKPANQSNRSKNIIEL